jgi:hypothetical protein
MLGEVGRGEAVSVPLRRPCEALGIDPDSQKKGPTDPKRCPWASTVMTMTVSGATSPAAITERSNSGAAAPTGVTGGEGTWITVTEAAASGCTEGIISRAATDGSLRSNGKVRRERRIDAASLTLWLLKRAKRPTPVESDAAVLRKLSRARGE